MTEQRAQSNPDAWTEEALVLSSIVRGILGDDFRPSEEPCRGPAETAPVSADFNSPSRKEAERFADVLFRVIAQAGSAGVRPRDVFDVDGLLGALRDDGFTAGDDVYDTLVGLRRRLKALLRERKTLLEQVTSDAVAAERRRALNDGRDITERA